MGRHHSHAPNSMALSVLPGKCMCALHGELHNNNGTRYTMPSRLWQTIKTIRLGKSHMNIVAGHVPPPHQYCTEEIPESSTIQDTAEKLKTRK